ncbi:Muramoyltetrapeptide carboxypeptidase LdcA (peptidoglycan recycling) [Mesobacillus persicus]|uniref:Muramoyltetrapeptide carboxypeptidase LdcA (Peptidoglycan recycling) n=1 Tax=Mesobacillus persicus TaxID=930146 RepID=A0A1H8BEX9_9BACI|nr:S66 peptidase family protein [Mesobacillus persicus]SEM81383.1 Muramoyltetrapeptide carboxypeptidase LdcA (peptidoglycan recycling) [Mesobacillus persicus]
MLAQRLTPGDEIRVIAPSTSMAVVKGKQIDLAVNRLNDLGFKVTFGKYSENHDEFFSTTVKERIADLHDAFSDRQVKAVLTGVGGYNANQLLRHIDYDLIKDNPKIFCGYNDITSLQLAIYRKTGLVTYYGPHFSSFGVKHGFEYTLKSFLEAVTNDAPFEIEPSEVWSDDPWFLEQEQRNFVQNTGYTILQGGNASGKLIGGNLSTINLLQGTEYMPSLHNSILFIEDDEETHARIFDRQLQSLLHQPDAAGIKAILIGRFQKDSQITETALRQIIASKSELRGIPVIANVNIGHVQPFATLPIGSTATVTVVSNNVEISVDQMEYNES